MKKVIVIDRDSAGSVVETKPINDDIYLKIKNVSKRFVLTHVKEDAKLKFQHTNNSKYIPNK